MYILEIFLEFEPSLSCTLSFDLDDEYNKNKNRLINNNR